MRRDPFAQDERLPAVAAREYFTDREGAIEAFLRYVNAPQPDPLRVLVFYGVGGIGKTALIQRLAEKLEDASPPVSYAVFNMDAVGDQTRAYREVLLRFRCDLEARFGMVFPRFDLCWAVMMAREGGDPPPYMQLHPGLSQALTFALALLQHPLSVPGHFLHISGHAVAEGVKRLIERSEPLEKLVRHAGGTDAVIELRDRALKDDEALPEELVKRFVQDLKEHLPSRDDQTCRSVLFLDTYERLWAGREAAISAQARLLDAWVRSLASYCLGSGVLLVIGSRDRLAWADAEPEWQEDLDQHLLGGLSARDAQTFLARCEIGRAPVSAASRLQEAIIACCNESRNPSDVSCHPLYLALCAEIVLNTHRAKRIDPRPETFTRIPASRTAGELATRFLRSLHNSALEFLVRDLSLTPRFDAEAPGP